jgi:methyl-accepting chemotaxis protein
VKDDANATSEKLAGIIEDVGRVFAGLASGDLSQRITRDAEGIFDQVKTDANSSCDKLAGIIEEVRAAADALTGAANQVSATAQSLSQAASEQASSVEETTASIDLMSRLDHAEQRQRPRHRRHGHQGQHAKPARAASAVTQTVAAMKQIAAEDQHRRRHRLPDQPAGAERRHRGRPRRRARQGLRGGGRRGAQAGRAQPGSGARRSATWPATA